MNSKFTSFFFGSLRRSMAFAALALLGLGAVAMMARGQNTPAAADSAGTTLTLDQLGSALDSYGKNTQTSNGNTSYSITVPKGKWNINIIISLSPNGHVIWMTNNLTELPDAGKVSVTDLLNVLKKNTDSGPMFFSIDGTSLRLNDPVPNYDMTAAGVKANIDALLSTVSDTESLWSSDALSGTAPAAQPAGQGAGNPLAK
jgi:hypothetical protein